MIDYDLAKLVHKTTITIVYDTDLAIFRWGYKPTYNWGAPSSADLHHNPYANHGAEIFTNICPNKITQFCR